MRHLENFEPQFLKPEEEPAAGEKIDSEVNSEQASLRNKIDWAKRPFRLFRFIDNERERHHLDPLFKIDYSDQYIKDLIPFSYPEDQKLTEEDLHQTENKVLSFVLEIADQILRKRGSSESTNRSVREDPKLLEQAYLTLKKGERLFTEVQKRRPQEVQELLKKILIERKGLSKEDVKPEDLKQLVDSIGNASSFIHRKEKALEGYFGKKIIS